MTKKDELCEDLQDVSDLLRSAREPSRPYEEFLAELASAKSGQSVVPWKCERCGRQVHPELPFRDPGRVCSQCNRVICRRCLDRRASTLDPLCRDCARQDSAL